MANAFKRPIAAFNEILGCTIDDPKVSQIASDVGAVYTVWQDEEIPDIHWIFEGMGLEFCFDDEILTAIFFQFFAEDVWNVGSWSGPLIDSFVAPDITPEQVDSTLGSPRTRTPSSSARTSTATCAPPPPPRFRSMTSR